MKANVKAELFFRQRLALDENSFAELVIWRLPRVLPGSRHRYKYSLAYIEDGVCAIRYDNEAGKGDHRHVGNREYDYSFVDADQLMVDFWSDVDRWRRT